MQTLNNLQSTQSGSRLPYLDIAKGILIILAILGHSNFAHSIYIYWFHIPAFFMISGLLHKQPPTLEIRSFVIRKIRSLIVPYFAFGITIALILCGSLWKTESANFIQVFIAQLGRLLFGGKALFGSFGIFWFINCLFLAIITFTAVLHFIEKIHIQITVLIGMYAIGMFLMQYKSVFLPWHIGLVPIAVSYYAIGYYLKNQVKWLYKHSEKWAVILIPIIILSAVLMYLYETGRFFFYIDMKIQEFSNPVLSILIPVLFALDTILISMILSRRVMGKILAYVGFNSLAIMFLHAPLNNAIRFFTQTEPHYMLFVICGLTGSLVCGFLLNKIAWSRAVFLGRYNRSPAFAEAASIKTGTAVI